MSHVSGPKIIVILK